MEWEKLFTTKRFGETKDKHSTRGQFQVDHDRLIFSQQFRNLQNKTQVFPLPGAIYVHNRLTHSLEVAAVGRSLGNMVGKKITDKHVLSAKAKKFYKNDLAEVIRVACLSHDIGNPPFGHSGEDAIRNFFESKSKEPFFQEFTENQKQDFLKFEGNANAFRILGPIFKSQGLKMNLTTLASIVKYPVDSKQGFNKKFLRTKKSGFFDSETEIFKEIADIFELPTYGLNQYGRHPFVFLVEAADDICYRIIDLEDACSLGIISYEEVESLLLPFFVGRKEESYLSEKLPTIKNSSQKLALIRAFLINLLVDESAKVFMENEEELLNGILNKSLIDCLNPDYINYLKKIDSLSFSKIYEHRNVINLEIIGFKILNGLLEEFIDAVLNPSSAYSKKILSLMDISIGEINNYKRIQLVLDYISGMTDLYALDLYKKIKGIEIPFI